MAADQPARTPTSPRPNRWLTVAAGLGVAVLAGAAFVLTYDDLRTLALAGGAARRWAPAYPLMADALITVTVLALVAARHAHWWSRLLRWSLLVLLLAGAAAAGVQRALNGYGSLPERPLKAGVAVAPHLLILIAVWLWLTMFRHVRHARHAGHVHRPTPKPPESESEPPAETEEIDEPEDHNGEMIPGLADLPVPEPPEVDPRVPEVPADMTADPTTSPAAAALDDDPTPPAGFPVLLPTDVELVRTGPKPVKPATTTQPDFAVPVPEDPEADDEEPEEDRAEDPDAGDEDESSGPGRHRLRRPYSPAPVPGIDEAADETDIEWTPPSSKFRSSPTPPQD